MNEQQIFILMMILGMFSFLGFGISSANSIEAKNNIIVGNILTFLTFIGLLSFLVGFCGLIVINIK